jgi:hypothetical protein
MHLDLIDDTFAVAFAFSSSSAKEVDVGIHGS